MPGSARPAKTAPHPPARPAAPAPPRASQAMRASLAMGLLVIQKTPRVIGARQQASVIAPEQAIAIQREPVVEPVAQAGGDNPQHPPPTPGPRQLRDYAQQRF